MTDTQIRTTAKLLDARDTMRRLHGDEWPQKINQISPVIRGVAADSKVSILSAAIQIAKKASDDGQPMVSVMVLAVACELAENSEAGTAEPDARINPQRNPPLPAPICYTAI